MTLTYVPAVGNFTDAGTYVDGSGAPQLRVHCLKKGTFGMPNVTVIRDGAGGKVLAAVHANTGMTEDVFRIYRAVPSYEGQEPLEGAAHAFAGYDLAQVGLGERCFLWAQVDAKRGLSTGRNAFPKRAGGGCTYSVRGATKASPDTPQADAKSALPPFPWAPYPPFSAQER